jgi:hypothetical protein
VKSSGWGRPASSDCILHVSNTCIMMYETDSYVDMFKVVTLTCSWLTCEGTSGCCTHHLHLIGGLHTFVLEMRAADDVFTVSFNIGVTCDTEGIFGLVIMLGERAESV